MDPCFTNASEEACAAANGLPATTQTTSGTDAPEGNVVGYRVGDLYVRTSTSKLYFFNGTPRSSTGWVILN